MTQRISIDAVAAAVREGFGDVEITARRPGKIFQVNLPAFLADGDGVSVFLEPGRSPETFKVTDLANTLMRLSYAQDVNPDMVSRLEKLADRNGFVMHEGEISVEVSPRELSAALMGMIQVQACAEAAIRPPVASSKAENFRRMVMEALRSEFGANLREQVRVDDGPEEFALDAVIDLGRPVAVVPVPNDIAAERALTNKIRLGEAQRNFRWLAVPKNVDALQEKTRKRLLSEYYLTDVGKLTERVIDLAAA